MCLYGRCGCGPSMARRVAGERVAVAILLLVSLRLACGEQLPIHHHVEGVGWLTCTHHTQCTVTPHAAVRRLSSRCSMCESGPTLRVVHHHVWNKAWEVWKAWEQGAPAVWTTAPAGTRRKAATLASRARSASEKLWKSVEGIAAYLGCSKPRTVEHMVQREVSAHVRIDAECVTASHVQRDVSAFVCTECC